MRADLILRNGRIIDLSQGIDQVTDVAFSDGKIAALGDGLAAEGATVRDVRGKIVTPGLIDLHTHVYWGGDRRSRRVSASCRARRRASCL